MFPATTRIGLAFSASVPLHGKWVLTSLVRSVMEVLLFINCTCIFPAPRVMWKCNYPRWHSSCFVAIPWQEAANGRRTEFALVAQGSYCFVTNILGWMEQRRILEMKITMVCLAIGTVLNFKRKAQQAQIYSYDQNFCVSEQEWHQSEKRDRCYGCKSFQNN